MPPSDPVACGGDGGTTSGAWPLLPIDRAKETAAALYFKEVNKAWYPLNLFSWLSVGASTSF